MGRNYTLLPLPLLVGDCVIDGIRKDLNKKKLLEKQIEDLRQTRAEIEYQILELESSRVEIDAQILDLENTITQSSVLIENPSADESNLAKTEKGSVFGLLLNDRPVSPLVTKESPATAKFELFISLFSGRPDMHARRYETQGGKQGYGPVCSNKFRHGLCGLKDKLGRSSPCVDCIHQDFPPITLEEFMAHREGRSATASDVLAAYAIDHDSMCSFIVADFDNKNEESDCTFSNALKDSVTSFIKVCERYLIPVYPERSRSGKGFHVWLFFEDPVPAKLARRLYSAVLTCAMDDNPQVSFDFYDRFIPHQDSIPSDRFGNLIALPLQGRAWQKGGSVFLDGEFEPYPDQWEFLSRVKRFTSAELGSAISALPTKDDLGHIGDAASFGELGRKPWERKRPETPLTSKDFVGEVAIVEANMIHVEKSRLSTRAQSRIKQLAAFRNPEFYDYQMKRLDARDKPRVISMAEESDEYISLPRGMKSVLIDLLKDGNASYAIEDKMQPGKRIHVSFKGELRKNQKQAIRALLDCNNGVLEAAPGFGKTVIGTKLIAERKTNTLVIVQNKNLLSQWKKALSSFLDITDEPPVYYTETGRERRCPTIGEYSGTKKRLSSLVDVAMAQSLYRKGEVQDLVKDYGMVIVDEAHHVPAVSFELLMRATNAKYVYALTATPERKDGHEPILFAQCGPIRYKDDASENKSLFERYVIPRFTTAMPKDMQKKFDMAQTYDELSEDRRRNDLIIEDVVSAVQRGRNPLVITQRTKHVDELSRLLAQRCKNVLPITGKMSTVEKRVFENRVRDMGETEQCIIVATGSYIGEGFDFDRLDTLFLVLPVSWKGTVTQYIGRLNRLYEGKARLEVYDYVDVRIPQVESMYRKRLKTYKKDGYKLASKSSGVLREDIIYGPDDYWASFLKDIKNACESIVVSCSHINLKRVHEIASELTELIENGVRVALLISLPKASSSSAIQQRKRSLALIDDLGAQIIESTEFSQRFAIVDSGIVWYGTLNYLGNSSADDSAIRIIDPEVAGALMTQNGGVENKGLT